MRRIRQMFGLIVFVLSCQASAAEAQLDDWQQVVRNSPYWISQGVFKNLETIRRWVLASRSYCENPQRHILFDRRATFLGYVEDAADAAQTQNKLNELRKQLVAAERAEFWVPGALDRIGYPFALNCHQPHAQLDVAMARYRGTDVSARLWGTWDGMEIGTQDEQVSLHEAIAQVYDYRHSQGRVTMPASILSTLAGKALIESAGQKHAHSAANARGIMQLSEAALRDCGLQERFYFHRLAQIDCALRLLEQNHRNLAPLFKSVFGHLPEEKAETLYDMLLIQAYHGGVGRIGNLLTDPEFAGPAEYFAEHHKKFSAGDMALGMVFHNLGRNQMGFASLYYVVDVAIATEAACQMVDELPGCPQREG